MFFFSLECIGVLSVLSKKRKTTTESLDLISGDKENVGNVSKRYAIHIVLKAITTLSEPCGYPALPCYNGMIEKQFKLWSHSILM